MFDECGAEKQLAGVPTTMSELHSGVIYDICNAKAVIYDIDSIYEDVPDVFQIVHAHATRNP